MIKKKEKKVDLKKVWKLYKSLKKEDLLDDRKEYDVEDLKKAYPELSNSEAKLLYNILHKKKK